MGAGSGRELKEAEGWLRGRLSWLLSSRHASVWTPGPRAGRPPQACGWWSPMTRRREAGRLPYLVGPDERLHRQVVLHQLVHVGLGTHHGLRACCDRQGTGAQEQWALVGGARRRPGIGVSEKNVP